MFEFVVGERMRKFTIRGEFTIDELKHVNMSQPLSLVVVESEMCGLLHLSLMRSKQSLTRKEIKAIKKKSHEHLWFPSDDINRVNSPEIKRKWICVCGNSKWVKEK